MKTTVLLSALLAGAVLLNGCSSKTEETKQENKQEQQQEKKEKFSVESIKYENRKDPNFKYLSYGFLKLNSEDWSKLTDEKIYNLVKEWNEKRDTYHNKSLIIYNEDTKKALISLGTEDVINYRPFEINVSQKEKFDTSNPTETMFMWSEKTKKYVHVETQAPLDITK